jgi:hypothetical protein
MAEEQSCERVINAAEEIDGKKKLACKKAFELSEEFGISLHDITRCCNQNDIKIYACQLGCFK